MDDIDEVNINHLLSRLASINDPDFSATINLMKELIKLIDARIIELNKKSKKNNRNYNNAQIRVSD